MHDTRPSSELTGSRGSEPAPPDSTVGGEIVARLSLDESPVPLGTLLGLRVGSVLELSCRVDQPLRLSAANGFEATGVAVEREGRFGFLVDSLRQRPARGCGDEAGGDEAGGTHDAS